MQAIVSLLDDHHDRLTETLWHELEAQFGLRGVYATPYPHFSYHVARNYDRAGLASVLERFVRDIPPFQVTTTGLGVFAGPSPVLYIPVVRNPVLTDFHRALWSELAACADGSAIYYSPDRWLPHITLGSGDLTADVLAEAVRLLAVRDFNWTVTANNLVFIEEDALQGQRLGFRLDFRGHND